MAFKRSAVRSRLSPPEARQKQEKPWNHLISRFFLFQKWEIRSIRFLCLCAWFLMEILEIKRSGIMKEMKSPFLSAASHSDNSKDRRCLARCTKRKRILGCACNCWCCWRKAPPPAWKLSWHPSPPFGAWQCPSLHPSAAPRLGTAVHSFTKSCPQAPLLCGKWGSRQRFPPWWRRNSTWFSS